MKVVLKKELQGSILDIGGGGEGIMGQIYGSQVVAIDNRQEELDEAPDGFEKILMDAGNMTFAAETFAHVTSFYSLMYMDKETQLAALGEAFRVVRTGGQLHIWDAEFACAYPDPFVAELDIDANGKHIHTTYGIIKDDAGQSMEYFIDLCGQIGFCVVDRERHGAHFHLRSVKLEWTKGRQK